MNDSSKLNIELTTIDSVDMSKNFPEYLSDIDLLEMLKISTELAADEVFWMKPNSEIVYVNNAACEKLGYSQEELIGKKVWEWDPMFSKAIWPAFLKELKGKKHIDFEAQHQNRSGDIFPVQVKAHYVGFGEKEMIIAFASDISEFKQQERELKAHSDQFQIKLEQEKKKFSEFVSLAPIGIAINRLEDGKFDYINGEFSRFTGYSVEELNNMDYWQLTPSEYAEQEEKQIEDMIEMGRYGPYLKEYIHKSGHRYPVLLSGIKIKELDGKEYIWSVVQDISHQKKIEKEIQDAKEEADLINFRMQLANNSAGIGVWEWDITTNALVWDKWMYKLYGISEAQFSGAYEAWENGVHPEDIEYTRLKLAAALDEGQPYNPEYRIVRPDGEIRTLETSGEIIRDKSGKALKFIGVNYDITDKVMAMNKLEEAKLEADNAVKAKSDFLANMSHEIRTPMNAISGGLQLLRNANLDEDLKIILENASYSAKSLLTIINDILDYSKIESNKLTLEESPFSIIEVLDSVKHDVDPIVSSKDIALSTVVENSFIDGWLGDVVRVKQVLLNLTTNAVKFTNKGGVKVELSNVILHGKTAISIRVIDSGIGMSQEVQSRIFKRFTQADMSTTRKYGGTGLGMSITVNLIKMMKGTIDVSSQLGEGTTVHVILPLSQTTLKLKEQKQPIISPKIPGKKILIAEDNKINQVLIKTALKASEADLTLVENGKLAVEAIEKEDFDLVLMDIHMPEMDGIEAQQKIRLIKGHIPVIALTANVMVEDVERYLEKGFVTHIGKPIDMKALYNALNNYIVCR